MVTKQVTVKSNYKQIEAAHIPKEWNSSFLSSIAKIERGKFTHRPRNDPKFYGGKYPFIQTGDVESSGGKITTYSQTLNDKGLSVSKLFPENTIIITIAANIGSTAITTFPICFPDSLIGISSNEINIEFLEYFLRTRKRYLNNIASNSAQKNINLETLNSLTIFFPNQLHEQQKIAMVLTDINKLIEHLQNQISKKNNIKQATMQELLTGKRRLAGFEEEWKERTLKEIGVFTKGKGIKKTEVVDYGLPCIRYGEIYTKYDVNVNETQSHIPSDVAKKSQQIKNGELLFTGSGETPDEIGKCIVYQGKNPCYAGGDIIIFSINENDPLFLAFLLNSDYVQKQKSCMAQGDMVVHIYSSSLAKLKIKIPDIPEQQEIAKILSDINSEIQELESRKTIFPTL